MPKSTTTAAGDKARNVAAAREFKQAEKIPLIAHGSLRWARKVKGRLHYFGSIDGISAASAHQAHGPGRYLECGDLSPLFGGPKAAASRRTPKGGSVKRTTLK